MRNYKLRVGGALTTSIVAALFSASAAASVNYSFSGGSGQDVTGAAFTAAGGPNVTVTGWANTTAAGSTSTMADDKLASQTVKLWNGLGVQNILDGTGSPQHSTDNNGPVDMILFSFASDIALTGLSIGWSQTDSDMSVLAYTGSGAPASLTGKTYADLTAPGGNWSLISHLSDVSNVSNNSSSITGSATFNNSTSKIFSSYWLVGAYNPLVGSNMNWTSTNDYVKVSGLTGENKPTNGGGQVPEPATLLLMGAGLVGMTYVRRRREGVATVKDDSSLSC